MSGLKKGDTRYALLQRRLAQAGTPRPVYDYGREAPLAELRPLMAAHGWRYSYILRAWVPAVSAGEAGAG